MRARRIVMPDTARAGEIVEIRALIQHPMVTGHTAAGANSQPRLIIHTLVVTYDGGEVLRADLLPGIAANPSIAFTTRATRTGDISFTWTDDRGETATETRRLTVT